MQELDSISYNEKINEDKLTIIKYKANWCGPCRVLSPILEGVVKNYTDINVGEVDIDANMALAQKDGIRGVPTIVFYKNGKMLDKIIGLQQAPAYQAKIDSLK